MTTTVVGSERESVLARAKKLLDLKAGTNFTGEAAAAAAALERLLLEYNLEMADVEGVNLKPGEDYIRFKFELGVPFGALSNWRRLLVFELARASFSTAFSVPTYNTAREQYMIIVGQQTNLDMVRFLYDYLARELDGNLSKKYLQRDREKGVTTHVLRWKDAFFRGAVDEIGKRLREERRLFVKESEKAFALVPVKERELAEATKKLVPHSTRGGDYGGSNLSGAGYASGRAAGKEVSLNRPLTSGSSNGKLTG